MARPVRNERHEDRPGAWDPFFTGSMKVPGYSVPSEVDNTGYTLSDPGADSTVPDRYGIDLDPSPGSAILGDPAGSVGTIWKGQVQPIAPLADDPTGMASGDNFYGPNHAQHAAPLDFGSGTSPEHSISDLDTGSLYDGGGWPTPPSGSYAGPLRAARARPIREELENLDDYRQNDPVDDLGRPNPGRLRSSQRGVPA